ncbi:LppU/SCO3897 family protein [Micromonospora sp. DT228]|uniref:LppU/SCO3897 family protein n=1 Tax=Micromonospora sp. DT228 TaxID=3393443 RepID=UPI003CFA1908
MPEQVATPPASDGAPAEPAVEAPQPTVETPRSAEPKAGVSRPAEPKSTEPKSTESELTKPRPTGSESTESGLIESKAAESGPTGSEPAEPESAESRPAEPKSTESESGESGLAEPKSAEPESGESVPAEPKSTEPRPTGSDSGEPESAELKSAESDSAEPESAEPEVKKSGAKKAFGIVGVILAIVVVAGLKFGVVSAIGNLINKDETAAAKAGDCIAKLPEVTGTKQEKVTDARIVECTSTEAVYNVVGRVDNQTEAQARADTACEQYFKPDEEGYIYSSILPGKTGYVLCLTKKA